MASPKLQQALVAALGKHEANELLALLGGTPLTPWTENIDADGNSLQDVAGITGEGSTFAITDTTFAVFGVPPATQAANVPPPSGGATIDTQARGAIEGCLNILQNFGFMAPEE